MPAYERKSHDQYWSRHVYEICDVDGIPRSAHYVVAGRSPTTHGRSFYGLKAQLY